MIYNGSYKLKLNEYNPWEIRDYFHVIDVEYRNSLIVLTTLESTAHPLTRRIFYPYVYKCDVNKHIPDGFVKNYQKIASLKINFSSFGYGDWRMCILFIE